MRKFDSLEAKKKRGGEKKKWDPFTGVLGEFVAKISFHPLGQVRDRE